MEKKKDDFGKQLCISEILQWLCQCKREYHSIKSGKQALGSFHNVYAWDHQQLTAQLERNVAGNWQGLFIHYSDRHIKDYFPVYLFQALFLLESDIFRFFASQVYLILLLGQGLTQKMNKWKTLSSFYVNNMICSTNKKTHDMKA